MADTTALKQIQDTLASISKPYYCSGTVPLGPDVSTLFYTKNDKPQAINFAAPTDQQLAALAEACQPATFGLKEKDVLDESYRKAGKMDPKDFCLQFSPLSTAIMDSIKQNLFLGRVSSRGDDSDEPTSIQVELYKLNVYGPGSFFKAHVDTPRGEHMFGSLVVVLPTVHEGGSLILRQSGKETVFDTAHAVNSTNSPQAAFVAFFSDVQHEVTPVTSGYRVTITYNLYFEDSAAQDERIVPELGTNAQQMKDLQLSLKKLLDDPKFLPEGGLLGFGLSHRYPFKVRTECGQLQKFSNRLKGSDNEVRRVCRALGLDVSLKAFYQDSVWDDEYCFLDEFLDFDGMDLVQEMTLVEWICKVYDRGGSLNPIVAHPSDANPAYLSSWMKDSQPIVWLRPLGESNAFESSYLHYGNEPSMSTAYGDVCLVAEVEAAEDRMNQ